VERSVADGDLVGDAMVEDRWDEVERELIVPKITCVAPKLIILNDLAKMMRIALRPVVRTASRPDSW